MSGTLSNVIICPNAPGGNISSAGNYAGSKRASLRILSENFMVAYDRFETTNVHNSISNPDDCAGVKRVSGDLSFAAHPEDIGFILTGALGNPAEAGSGATKTHTYTDPTSTHSPTLALPALSIEVYRAQQSTSAFRYFGMCVASTSLSFAVNQDVRSSSSFIGYDSLINQRTGTQLFSNTPARPFKFIDTAFSLDGVAAPGMETFTLTINNNLEGIASLNQDNRVYKISRSGGMQVTFDGTIEFEGFDAYNAFVDQDTFAIDIAISSGGRSLNINLPKCTYLSYPVAVQGRGRIIVSFSGKCDLSTTEGHTIEAVLSARRPSFGN